LASIPVVDPSSCSGGRLQPLALLLFQECHVEVTVILLPALVLLDREGPRQPQAARLVGKDAHDSGPPTDFLLKRSSMLDEQQKLDDGCRVRKNGAAMPKYCKWLPTGVEPVSSD
jgi:hypothetical protein